MIESLHNNKIKNLLKLNKTKERKKTETFAVEGRREIEICYKSKFDLLELFYCKDFWLNKKTEKIKFVDEFLKLDAKKATEVSKNVFQKISNRENPDGFIAVVKKRDLSLDKVRLKTKKPLILLLDQLEKPGNIGAILRTCDGVGVDLVLNCGSVTDIYNPNLIRASQGTVFSQAIVNVDNKSALEWLRLNKIKIISSTPHTSLPYYEENFNQSCAILLGSEDVGISEFWLENSDIKVKIPMYGKIDSLNVSVSGAILLYEALRQRKV